MTRALKKLAAVLLAFLMAGMLTQGAFSSLAVKKLVIKKRQQLIAVKQKLHAAKKQLAEASAKKKVIATQLKGTWHALHQETDELNVESVQLRQTALNLQFTQQRLHYAQAEYSDTKSRLSRRLKQVSEAEQPTFSDVLIGSESYSGLLDRSHNLGLILNQDVETAKGEKTSQARISGQADQLKGEYKEIHAARNDDKVKYQMYSNIAAARQGLLGQAQVEEQTYSKEVGQLEEISAAIERQMEDLVREEEEKLRVSHHHFSNVGALLWPVKSHYITSPFGWRFHPILHRTLFHTGVDIAADTGEPIHVAADGVVIYAGWYGGYGNAVVVDHGGGLSTLYAHCSVIYVKKGESVAQGEVIAGVGMTGYATGPHLHFEVRVDGKPINPMSRF